MMTKILRLKSDIFEWAIHILFWLVFIIVPNVVRERPMPPFPDNKVFMDHMPDMYNPLWILMPFIILYFYLNYLVFSRFYKQREYLKYAILNIITVFAFLGIKIIFESWMWQPRFQNYFFDFMLFLFMFLLSTSITIVKVQSVTAKHLKDSEISFLRNQINPHFLFNVMNMIVVFSRKYPDKVESSVNTLSDILRYMIYDTKQKSKVGYEIMVIEQYLSLQRLRFGDEVEIRTSFDETDNNIMIEPMLLIPIIENAFKHGTSMVKSPVIDISTKSKDGILYFKVKNKFSPLYISSLTTYSGLGLANIKRRLDLLYPGKYEFHEEMADGEWFIVQIIIDCR